ncbi:MAG: tetratricopeptide repeat protein [Alphaproteobacteria bacterium]|nr:tetratricopeptide repeat protein [Alphaproteobacteria bacterium]
MSVIVLLLGSIVTVQAADITALKAGAEAGQAEAQYSLGLAYESGEGVAQDDFEAVRWLRAAAERDYPPAALDLGWMLANGYGVSKDIDQAYFWFVRAAALGAEGAADQRDALARSLDTARRAQLAQEALSDLPVSLEPAAQAPALAVASDPVLQPGDTVDALLAQLNAGGGLDVLAKLRLLAKDGNIQARNVLGLALRRSTDPIDRAQGLDWLIAAAQNGLAAAQYNVAVALMYNARENPASGLDIRAVERWLDMAQAGSMPAPSDDYNAVAREFAARAGVKDAYRAAIQGSIGAYPELRELIRLKRQELAAQQDFLNRLGNTAPPSSGRIESTIIQ